MRALAAVAGLLALHAASADAQQQRPAWELGLGVGALAFNDYRGASSSHLYVLPLPYFIYRGKVLRADRDGVHGIFFNLPRLQLNASIYATTPVRDSRARYGMPNLRPTLELGPSLDWHLWQSSDRHLQLDWRMPVRAAVTVQAPPHAIGWLFSPRLNLDITDPGGFAGWKLGLLAGPLFADRRYDDYFYGVAPQFARTGRVAYEAGGGYSGAQMLMSLSRRFPGYWIGAYLRYDVLDGASFVDSPLVLRRSYWSAGIGIAWLLKVSDHRVEASE